MTVVAFRVDESGKICGSVEEPYALAPAYQGDNLQRLR